MGGLSNSRGNSQKSAPAKNSHGNSKESVPVKKSAATARVLHPPDTPAPPSG